MSVIVKIIVLSYFTNTFVIKIKKNLISITRCRQYFTQADNYCSTYPIINNMTTLHTRPLDKKNKIKI